MHLTFWGAARTVTGSMHLLELGDGQRLLLDCGLFQGRRAEANRINRHLPFDAASVSAVVLSHAHIDHAGLLPRLWADGFRGRVWATPATRDLCEIMLRDSAFIQEGDAAFFNRKIRKPGEPAVEPLYTAEDAEGALRLFEPVGYRTPFAPLPGVEAEFRDAGHILGSATVTLTLTAGGKSYRLGFTGDVGNPGRPILRDPEPMPDCDGLITESTYGGETHAPPEQARHVLGDVVRRTAARGGRVVIPAFAVGRTQELAYALNALWNAGELPPIPVFVDSPLAVSATEVFRRHPECFDAATRTLLETDPDPFGFERLEYVREAARSKQLNEMAMPMVVISASGMCEAGRILHHLRHAVEDPKNTVFIVGYMAEHTLGKRIVERREEVNIFGRPHRLRAEVVVANAYSAHADEPGLLAFLGHMDRERLRHVWLVHGAPERQDAFAAALRREGYRGVAIPERGETVALA
jgi:metallo-beta-lactamase family protein